jgi:uncharacterized membrane protein YbhN (UPF0104 family)
MGSGCDDRGVPEHSTLVIEDGVIPRRVRRPIDLLRVVLSVGLIALILTLAYFASHTTSGLQHDVSTGARRLPAVLVLVVNAVSVLGVLLLPISTTVDLLLRRRSRQLLEAVLALVFVVLAVSGVARLILLYGSNAILEALTGSDNRTGRPLDALLAGLLAFITVARLMDRPRWSAFGALVVIGLFIGSVVNGGTTVAALSLSMLAGWGVGLAVRYTLGTPTTRPSGHEIAAALERTGYPVTVLRAARETDRGRAYVATSRSGEALEVRVLDRDLEGAGIANTLWRMLRLRTVIGLDAFSMRRTLERTALLSYATQAAGAPTPRLLAVSEIGPDSALLAHERLDGIRFPDLTEIADSDLERAWRGVRTLHEHHIAHRQLQADNLIRTNDGTVWILDGGSGTIAASDIMERIDIAELLCTLALLTDPERAVATGLRVLGRERLVRCLPTLQRVALSPGTRRALRKRRGVINELRDLLLPLTPDGQVENIQLERMSRRTLLAIVGGSVAAYLLLTQLGRVNMVQLINQASWQWALTALLLSALTYIAAAMSLQGFVPDQLSPWRTLLSQVAASFATLVAPPTLGAVAVNVRYLRRAGLNPALAAASVGVSQALAFVVHIMLLIGFGFAAGTSKDLHFHTPRFAIGVGIVLLVLLVILASLPAVRRWTIGRIRPIFAQVLPRLANLGQQPAKLTIGISGIVLLNLAYSACLAASVLAFGGKIAFAAVAFVYLAGSTLGQVAPTPGGLGAVEAALAAGLTATGIPSGVAISATLLFRLVTFWLPTIPGWFAFRWLQQKQAL